MTAPVKACRAYGKKPVIGIPSDRRMIAVRIRFMLSARSTSRPSRRPRVFAADHSVLETPARTWRDPRARRRHFLHRSADRTWSRVSTPGASAPGTLHDPHRDATTLSLTAGGGERRTRVLRVPRLPGNERRDGRHAASARARDRGSTTIHREDKEERSRAGAPAHEVWLEPDSVLVRWRHGRVRVNSHPWTRLDRLGPDLSVEARARTAYRSVRVRNASAFALAVQWHPEWQVMRNPFSQALFAEFGRAARNVKKNS